MQQQRGNAAGAGHLDRLPGPLLQHVFGHLSDGDLEHARLVSRRWSAAGAGCITSLTAPNDRQLLLLAHRFPKLTRLSIFPELWSFDCVPPLAECLNQIADTPEAVSSLVSLRCTVGEPYSYNTGKFGLGGMVDGTVFLQRCAAIEAALCRLTALTSLYCKKLPDLRHPLPQLKHLTYQPDGEDNFRYACTWDYSGPPPLRKVLEGAPLLESLDLLVNHETAFPTLSLLPALASLRRLRIACSSYLYDKFSYRVAEISRCSALTALAIEVEAGVSNIIQSLPQLRALHLLDNGGDGAYADNGCDGDSDDWPASSDWDPFDCAHKFACLVNLQYLCLNASKLWEPSNVTAFAAAMPHMVALSHVHLIIRGAPRRPRRTDEFIESAASNSCAAGGAPVVDTEAVDASLAGLLAPLGRLPALAVLQLTAHANYKHMDQYETSADVWRALRKPRAFAALRTLVLDTSTDHPDSRDEEDCWEDWDDEEVEMKQPLDCTDLAYAALGNLRRLQHLDVDPKFLQQLPVFCLAKDASAMRSLTALRASISVGCVRWLKHITGLRWLELLELDLQHHSRPHHAIAALACLPQLQALALGFQPCRLPDNVMQALTRCTRLTLLQLGSGGTQPSQAGVLALAGLSNLQHLQVQGTRSTLPARVFASLAMLLPALRYLIIPRPADVPQANWSFTARTFFLPGLPSRRFARWPHGGKASAETVMPVIRGPWDTDMFVCGFTE